ncbi:MAG: DNA gyrase inhibitor YacG [bacterium]
MRVRCPQCGREHDSTPSTNKYFPFCGRRCKLIDLGAWLDEDYAIPTPLVDGDGDTGEINDRDDSGIPDTEGPEGENEGSQR